MRFYHNAIIALCAAATICSISACKKENKADQNAAVEQALAVKVAWDKTQPNAYLEYIPADALAVLASTRNLDMQSDNLKNLQGFMQKYMQQPIKTLQDKLQNNGDNAGETALSGMLDTTLKLNTIFTDYAKAAPEWGLDVDGHFDTAVYFAGNALVAKVGYDDAAKFRAALEKFGADFWSSVGTPMVGEACITAVGKPAFVEKDVSGQKWQVLDLQPMLTHDSCLRATEKDMTVLPKTLAVHYGVNGVTIALASDETALPAQLEKASTPFDAKNFGEVAPDAILVGYTSNVKIVEKIIAVPDLAEALFKDMGETDAKACGSELVEILSDVASSRFVARVSVDGSFSASHALVASDEIKTVLRSIAAPHANLAQSETIATVGLNFSVGNAIGTVQELAKSIKERNFKCSLYAKTADGLNMAISLMANPMVMGIAKTITGVNIAVHDINPDAPEKSNFVVTLSGADMPSAVSKAKSMLAFKSPSLAMLKLDKGEVTSVDLKSLVDMPITMDAMLTDSDLILGTPGNDVKAISALPKATDGRIMSIMLNGNINQILKKAGVDEISLPPGCQVQLSFGVSATGPEMTSSVKFSK